MDAALTMQLLHTISGTPVLFADVRHYHADLDIWDLCNSGQHATWFAARSDDPAENLARSHLYPEVFYFPAGGASVHHLAAPGDMTFARLTRLGGRYRMHVLLGELEELRPGDQRTPDARLDLRMAARVCPLRRRQPTSFLGRFGANHIHAVPGDTGASCARSAACSTSTSTGSAELRAMGEPCDRCGHRHGVHQGCRCPARPGTVLAPCSSTARCPHPHPGWFEHDAETIWWGEFTASVAELHHRRSTRATVRRRCLRHRPLPTVGDQRGNPLRARRSSTASTPARPPRPAN